MREVDVLYYRKRHSQVASSIQKAVPLLNSTSPLMRSRLYSELAAIQARPGPANKQSVERYLALSHEAFPDHPENDPSFLYTHTNKYIILLNEALARLHLDQPKQADTAIAAAEAYVPVLASTWGLELLRHQTLIAIALGELERTQSKFEAVISAGLQFGTSFWLNDARDLYYENILSKWPGERKVKDLEDLLH